MTNLTLQVPVTLPAVNVPLPVETPRHALVRALKDYLVDLLFQRPGPSGSTFQVRRENILDEWPDPEKKVNYPTIAILPGIGEHQTLGLTPIVDEETADLYHPGTALVQTAEYAETLQLTSWAADRYERRALVAGLIGAFTPTDQLYGIHLKTSRDYFERVASYALVREELIDGEETVRNVRRADFYVEARIPVVRLMPFRVMRPSVQVDVEEVVSAAVLAGS